MRVLVLDIGNTAMKAGFFDEAGTLIAVHRVVRVAELAPLVAAFNPGRALVASVAAPAEEIAASLGLPRESTVAYTPGLPLPIQVAYQTPLTLGADRIAAAVGAVHLFPGRNLLILDGGTCLKADLVTADGIFRGGSISPGLRMRFEALPVFTKRLPLVEHSPADQASSLPGDTTENSIRAGVETGYVAEAAAFVAHYTARWPTIRVVCTGGDGAWLAARLPAEPPTFAVEPDLVLWGLYRILLSNTE